jgi:hypothetical protein
MADSAVLLEKRGSHHREKGCNSSLDSVLSTARVLVSMIARRDEVNCTVACLS